MPGGQKSFCPPYGDKKTFFLHIVGQNNFHSHTGKQKSCPPYAGDKKVFLHMGGQKIVTRNAGEKFLQNLLHDLETSETNKIFLLLRAMILPELA